MEFGEVMGGMFEGGRNVIDVRGEGGVERVYVGRGVEMENRVGE